MDSVPVLVINSGSSSIKYRLFDMNRRAILATGAVERIGAGNALFTHQDSISGETRREECCIGDHAIGFDRILTSLNRTGWANGDDDLCGIGHRVVHGGQSFRHPVLVASDTVEGIRRLSRLAPLHNPANLLGITTMMDCFPNVPQVAVFDTAFHQTLPPRAYRYALPNWAFAKHQVRRYGFHGTSHQSVVRQVAGYWGQPPEDLNLIVLHLGNGASAAAIEGGRSVDTSMGLTPLEGLVMGTRSGDLDPAALFHLQRETGKSWGELEAMLNEESGLVGLCGVRDMREILDRAAGHNPQASLALDVYVYRIKKYVGAYLAVLGRLDALVFTGGVGENAPEIRTRVCAGLGHLGIHLAESRNTRGTKGIQEIHSTDSPVSVLVVPTNEELEIAEQTLATIRSER